MSIAGILGFMKPKERKFYNLFEEGADNLVKAALLLNKLFLIKDKQEKDKIILDIKNHEKIGDDITHNIYNELNKTFITPFDREDINKLTGSLDDVLDMINSFCQKMRNHPPKTEPGCFLEMSELIVMACREIKAAILELKNLKNPKQIMKACIRINEIENEADDVFHASLSELFMKEKDAIELIKIKEMLGVLEKATDKAEDVSDVLKSIIIKAG